MLTEIDLDSTVSEKIISSSDRRRAREAESRRQNYKENYFEEEEENDPLLPSSDGSVTSTGTSSKHKYKQYQQTATVRGKRIYNFSITSKRPRRNVHKRSWAYSSNLPEIEEEESSRDSSTNKSDVHRAPRIAFTLLILVCCAGGYRFIDDYISRRKKGGIESFSDLKYAFRGSTPTAIVDVDDNNREVLSTKDDINNATTTEQHIEEIPNIDETIQLPDQLTNLVNIFSEPYNPNLNKLFLWHIPRSGSTTITRIASYCLGLTIASQQGKSEVESMAGSENEKDDGTTTVINELRINEGPDGVKFANVDMSNPQGIEHAKTLNVGSSPSVDLISSAYLWDLASIFDAQHQGYMIAMIRHPIERAVSLYYSMKNNKQYEEQVGSLSSVEQYAKSSLVENNWMTRFLSNTLSGELNDEQVAIAKEVLRTKCLIGLLRDKTETMRRLDVFFNLRAIEHTQRREECQEKLLYWDWPNKNRHDLIEKGSTAWDELYKHNMYDMQVYEYAEELFEAQKKLFQAIPSSW